MCGCENSKISFIFDLIAPRIWKFLNTVEVTIQFFFQVGKGQAEPQLGTDSDHDANELTSQQKIILQVPEPVKLRKIIYVSFVCNSGRKVWESQVFISKEVRMQVFIQNASHNLNYDY